MFVNPGVPLLTADVFRHFSGKFAPPSAVPKAIDSFDDLMAYIESKHNMLEQPAISLVPVIGDVLAAIAATPGCRLARMSGSGATCFGLYATQAEAAQAAATLQNQRPTWWIVATRL